MIDKFKDYIIKNENRSSDIQDENYESIRKHHNDWLKKFPILQNIELESDYVNETDIWLYSSIDKSDGFSFNYFLEIKKSDTWSFSLEIEQTAVTPEGESKLYLEESKSYEKNGLSYEQFMTFFKTAIKHTNHWNDSVQKNFNFKPLG